jgi:serine/threonine protein kinase
VGTKAVAPPSQEERRALYESLAGISIRGAWQLESLIDFGAMGAVYVARHKTDREARHAIKILDVDLSLSDRRYVRRFVREAEILKKIRHPNVVKVFEYGEHHSNSLPAPLHYSVMELIRGPEGPSINLYDYARTRELRMDEVVFIISQILAGLRHVHSKGVVHRDLKPWNVLLDTEGHCRIVDFGLAKVPGSDLTQVDELFGSREYIAPELYYRGAREATPTSDLYAVGRIFAELIDRVDFSRAGSAIFASKAAALRQLDGMMSRLAEEDPNLRFESAEDVMKVLSEFRQSTRIRTTVRSAARMAKNSSLRTEDLRRRIASVGRWVFDYGVFVAGLLLLPYVMSIGPWTGGVLAFSLVASKFVSALSHPPGRHPIRIAVRALATRLNRIDGDGDFRAQYYSCPRWRRRARFRAKHVSGRMRRSYRGAVYDPGVGVVGVAMAARCAVLLHDIPKWGSAVHQELFEKHLRTPRTMWALIDPTRRTHFCVPIFRIVGDRELRLVGVLAVDSRLPQAFLDNELKRAVKEYAAVIQDVIEPGHGAEVRQIVADGAAPIETILVNGLEPVIPPLGPRTTFADR